MAENLKVTHYRNGDPITKGILYPVGDRNNTNYSLKYYDYNDSSNSVIYGRLYGFGVIRDTRNITPSVTFQNHVLLYLFNFGKQIVI